VADPDIIFLRVSQVVNSTDEVADSYIVPTGKKATVIMFIGSAPDSAYAVTRLAWDYDTVDETDEWIIQRSDGMPIEYAPEFVGDNVKKLAVVCDNGCSGNYLFNGFAILEITNAS